jgi:hypothetical protein
MKPKRFVFRPQLVAITLHEAEKRVSLECEGVDGTAFIALEGSWIPGLAKSLQELAETRPDVLSWTRPPAKLQ